MAQNELVSIEEQLQYHEQTWQRNQTQLAMYTEKSSNVTSAVTKEKQLLEQLVT